MLIISHRRNQIEQLKDVKSEWGVEIDIRSALDQKGALALYLHHDPDGKGTPLKEWLVSFKMAGIRGPVIANTKEDGLETHIIEAFESLGLSNYLFLDTAIPTLVKWVFKNNNNRFFVRFSKYEPVEFVMQFANKASWLWVDCFNLEPVSCEHIKKLKDSGGFKICLVSPELQGGDASLISGEKFQSLIKLADAVCTKLPELYEQHPKIEPPNSELRRE